MINDLKCDRYDKHIAAPDRSLHIERKLLTVYDFSYNFLRREVQHFLQANEVEILKEKLVVALVDVHHPWKEFHNHVFQVFGVGFEHL